MSTTTTKHGLVKPDPTDFYDIEEYNETLDAIDNFYSPDNKPTATDVGAVSTSVTTHATVQDFNDFKSTGFYYFNYLSHLNAPVTTCNGLLFVISASSVEKQQMFFQFGANNVKQNVYFRKYHSGIWDEWDTVFLPLSGGTLRENTYVETAVAWKSIGVGNTSIGAKSLLMQDDKGGMYLQTGTGNDNRNILYVSKANHSDINEVVRLSVVENNVSKWYNLYGSHNMTSAPTTYDIPVSIANFSANGFNKYWKDKEGYVHITFNIKSASTSNSMSDGNVLFTLPAGFRPSTKQGFYGGYMATQTSSTRTACEFIINTDGTCVIYKGGTSCAYAMFSCSYYVG